MANELTEPVPLPLLGTVSIPGTSFLLTWLEPLPLNSLLDKGAEGLSSGILLFMNPFGIFLWLNNSAGRGLEN